MGMGQVVQKVHQLAQFYDLRFNMGLSVCEGESFHSPW